MHRMMLIVDLLAGALAFVVAWAYAAGYWRKRSREHLVTVVAALGLGGIGLWVFALRRALCLSGHYWLGHVVWLAGLGLAAAVVPGLIVAAVLTMRAAKRDRAERQRELAKDSPHPPPNESA